MKCRLFNIFSALSLLTCLATLALCVRGVWINDIIARYTPSGSWDIQNWHGRLILHVSNDPGDSPPSRTSWWPRAVTSADCDSPAFQKNWLNRVGFLYHRETWPTRQPDYDWPRRTARPAIQRHLYFRVPLWFVLLFTAVLPAMWMASRPAWLRRKRRDAGLCPTCAYDLRAHTPGDRCPECGTPIRPPDPHLRNPVPNRPWPKQ